MIWKYNPKPNWIKWYRGRKKPILRKEARLAMAGHKGSCIKMEVKRAPSERKMGPYKRGIGIKGLKFYKRGKGDVFNRHSATRVDIRSKRVRSWRVRIFDTFSSFLQHKNMKRVNTVLRPLREFAESTPRRVGIRFYSLPSKLGREFSYDSKRR